MASSYLEEASSAYQMRADEPSMIHCFRKGLALIEEMGEYQLLVPEFLLTYSRYLLVARQAPEAVASLSKAVLILKTIFTPRHPCLAPFYQFLAVGCLALYNHR
jgi:hypothetical protein